VHFFHQITPQIFKYFVRIQLIKLTSKTFPATINIPERLYQVESMVDNTGIFSNCLHDIHYNAACYSVIIIQLG